MSDLLQVRNPLSNGVLIAPLTGPTAFLAYATIDSLAKGEPFTLGLWLVMAAAHYMFGLPISYGAMLLLGLPYAMWLQKHRQLGWLQICFGASLIGCIAFSAIWALGYQSSGSLVFSSAVGSIAGLLSGLVFCVVVGPNNSFKPNPLRGSA